MKYLNLETESKLFSMKSQNFLETFRSFFKNLDLTYKISKKSQAFLEK